MEVIPGSWGDHSDAICVLVFHSVYYKCSQMILKTGSLEVKINKTFVLLLFVAALIICFDVSVLVKENRSSSDSDSVAAEQSQQIPSPQTDGGFNSLGTSQNYSAETRRWIDDNPEISKIITGCGPYISADSNADDFTPGDEGLLVTAYPGLVDLIYDMDDSVARDGVNCISLALGYSSSNDALWNDLKSLGENGWSSNPETYWDLDPMKIGDVKVRCLVGDNGSNRCIFGDRRE